MYYIDMDKLYEGKMRLNIKNNRHGFSLVEVMVAMGMLGVFSAGLYAVMSTMNSQYKLTNLRSDRDFLRNQVESILSQPHSCALNFSAINLGLTPQLSITSLRQFNDLGTPIASAVGSLDTVINASSELKVTQMKLVTPGAVSGSPLLVSSDGSVSTYTADFVISLKSPDKMLPLKAIVVPGLVLRTDVAGTFQSCELRATASASALCGQLGQVWDSVHSECVPSLASACRVVGGTVSGSRCIAMNVISKTCPSGKAITGFASDGEPVCTTIASSTTTTIPANSTSSTSNSYSWKLFTSQRGQTSTPSSGTRPTCDIFSRGVLWYTQTRNSYVASVSTYDAGTRIHYNPGDTVPGYYEVYRCDDF